jgi:hypothetical protein
MHNDHPIAITMSLRDGAGSVRRQTLTADIIKLGRGKGSDVSIDDDNIARMHAVIEVQGLESVTLIDLGNETLVNGARISKCKLSAGDQITIGNTTITVETIIHGAASRVAAAQPIADNPFLEPVKSPFNFAALRAVKSSVASDAAEGAYEYRLMKSAPDVPADECETPADAIGVKVSWGRNVLQMAHIDADASYWLGEVEDKAFRCDYFVPKAKLGTGRAPLVLGGNAIILPGAVGSLELDGRPAMTLEEAIAQGMTTPCAELAGGHEIALTNGTTLTMHLDDLVFEVTGEKRGRKTATAFTFAALAGGAAAYVLASFVGHAGLLAAMATFMPPLGTTGEDDISDEQRIYLSQYLVAQGHEENEAREDENLAEEMDGNEGGQGKRAKGAEGSMGDTTSKKENGRFAIKGDQNNPDPHISKYRMLEEARSFGAIGLLSGLAGSEDAPIAPWGRIEADGNDALSANGNMWSEQIGTAFGASGLGLSGIGEGGGGFGEGIGLDSVGTIGHGAGGGDLMGFGPGGGFGLSSGRLKPRHKTGVPRVRIAGTSVSGRLPPEVIQRIVRQNYGRFRACYQASLQTNPNLSGRVVASFIIGRDGTVKSVSGGGDLPDSGVISCVTRSFYGLTFPQPDGGIVRVTYPIVFSAG